MGVVKEEIVVCFGEVLKWCSEDPGSLQVITDQLG